MAKQVIVDGFDICKPQECKDETEVVILSINSSCNVNVVWTVYNNDNIPSSSEIQWSFNNKTFSNSTGNTIGNKPWEKTINISGTGVLYLKAKVIIDNQSYFSEINSFVIGSCSSSSSSSASICSCTGCPDDCCPPDDYDADGNGEFYIQWNTYSIPSKVLVVTPALDGDCLTKNNCDYSQSTILFESECEKTDGWECSCFIANQNNLPLGIIVLPDCEGFGDVWWSIYICGPGGYEYSAEGDNDGLCCPH
ncbi:hypothetical protein LCGC14_3001880 [marine sediment metagenome]|uniref:Uncharacterized protein n=1 Tax=marine sediment metagenome TaxID=412755 RepID=A0A0F8X188_9ZZZZ